jgi:predicted acylesterase/phospholipase RssA
MGKATNVALALRETNVVHMCAATFERLTRAHPQLTQRITAIIVERRQRALVPGRTEAPRSLSIALVPANPELDIESFARDLAEALAQLGETELMTAGHFESLFGFAGAAQADVGSPTHSAIVTWLDAFELGRRYLLFVAEASATAWTHRCLDHADRVLIVADPDSAPEPGPVEALIARKAVAVRTDLALWHPAGTVRPLGTAAWLDARNVRSHHHVRRGDTGHMGRLARHLVGKAISLVLSGGGARGFAHLGVFRAMEGMGVPVDYVGATSMGAVVGAAIAVYQSSQTASELAHRFANRDAIFDRTLPFTALMASHKVTRLMQVAFGDLRIEDLWVPFFCVASNLNTAAPVLYHRGPLWRAVRASLAIPGVFTPVMEDGEAIVDGGVIDNFPVRVMARLAESENIIGVNVQPLVEKKRHYDFDTHLSGWRILTRRLNPFSRPLRAPSLVGILLRAQELNSVSRAKEEEACAAVLVHPDVKSYSLQAYDRFAEIAGKGEEAAEAPLAAWLAETTLW